MKFSISPNLKGIIFDANVLSLLAKEDKLDLLGQIFALPRYITLGIQDELEQGIKNGVHYLQDVLVLIDHDDVELLVLSAIEKQFMKTLPPKLGVGEAEAIAVCQHRSMAFVTHDRKSANYCDRVGIACTRLRALLATLSQAGLVTNEEIDRILLM